MYGLELDVGGGRSWSIGLSPPFGICSPFEIVMTCWGGVEAADDEVDELDGADCRLDIEFPLPNPGSKFW
jgi:hypothetical protein